MASADEPNSQMAQTQEIPLTTGQQPSSELEMAAQMGGGGAIAEGPGSVAVAGSVHGPIHTGSGYIIQNFAQYVTNPPPVRTVLRDIGDLLKRNQWLIGLTFVLQIPLAILFFTVKDRFLISGWIYLTLAFLLEFAGWRWLRMIQMRPRGRALQKSLLLACAGTVAWAGLLSQQAWQAIHPAKFAADQFGIAVATFGEGASHRSSPLGREITHLLMDELEDAIEDKTAPAQFKRKTSRDPAATLVGVIRDESQAVADGKRVGAELVLWGKILEAKSGSEIHFQAIEAPDITDDPFFPQALLVNTKMESHMALDSANPVQIQEMVSAQNAVIVPYVLGLYYYYDLDFQSAAEEFDTALSNRTSANSSFSLIDPAIIYYYLGKSYQLLEKYVKAQLALEEAARLDPKEPAVALALAYNYRAMGLEEEKDEALRQAIKLCNDLPSTYIAAIYDRALAHEGQEDFEAALREYRAIQREQPDFFIAYLSAARALMRLGRLDEAMKEYQRASPLAEGEAAKKAWLSLDMGDLYRRMGDQLHPALAQARAQDALAMYDQAIRLAPTLSLPYFRRAQLNEKLKMFDAAYEDYQKFTEVSSQPHWAHETFAEFLRRRGKLKEAIEEYQEALRHPVYNDALTHARLGMAYASLGERFLAIAAFEEALQTSSPDEAYIRAEYGKALASFGYAEYGKALASFGYAEYGKDLGFEYFQRAILQFERSLEINTENDPITMLNLGQLYEEVKLWQAAIAIYEEVISLEGQIPDELLNEARERLKSLPEQEG